MCVWRMRTRSKTTNGSVTGTVQAFKIDYEGDTNTMPILTDGEIIRRNAPLGDPYVYLAF